MAKGAGASAANVLKDIGRETSRRLSTEEKT